MLTIIYASRAAEGIQDADLTQLLSAARTRNRREDVTGMLLFAYGSFLQQLEGPDQAVIDIFASIEADPRHSQIRVLRNAAITERRYPDWAMGFEHPEPEALTERLPGFRPALAAPLINSDLITDAEVAESVLQLFASEGSGAGV